MYHLATLVETHSPHSDKRQRQIKRKEDFFLTYFFRAGWPDWPNLGYFIVLFTLGILKRLSNYKRQMFGRQKCVLILTINDTCWTKFWASFSRNHHLVALLHRQACSLWRKRKKNAMKNVGIAF
jgi:hypothetical protein